MMEPKFRMDVSLVDSVWLLTFALGATTIGLAIKLVLRALVPPELTVAQLFGAAVGFVPLVVLFSMIAYIAKDLTLPPKK